MNLTELSEIYSNTSSFSVIDYVVFVCMLLVCIVIGVYFGFFQVAESSQDYLIGERKMKTFPITMSLIASYISGITLLGTPTEVYVYGIQYFYIAGGIILMGILTKFIYLPVFHELKLTSSYEYLEKRFDKRMRLFGSILFSISMCTWLPIVIFIPALAFNQVTGINVHIITPIVCCVCIFYTSLGGIKAVVWTDVIQSFVMCISILLVITKGTADVGGFGVVWERNLNSGRIEPPNLDIDPRTRHTLWSLIIGGCMYWVQTNALHQTMLQRYLALPNLQAANRALWGFILGVLILLSCCCYNGMLIYATYHNCDPLKTKVVKAKDQLLPFLVIDVLSPYPGLSGLFFAGIFSAALSSLSTGLNSMSAVVLEDFYKPFLKDYVHINTNVILKSVVIIFGILCVGLSVIMEKLGTVLQLSISLEAMASGPLLGIFTMGILLPWISSLGAFIGGMSGLCFMAWFCFNIQFAISTGAIRFNEKPTTIENCTYTNFVTNQTENINTPLEDPDDILELFRLSYLWTTFLGAFVTILLGLIASYFTKWNNLKEVNLNLLSPVIRKALTSKYDLSSIPSREPKYNFDDLRSAEATETSV